MRSAYPDYKEDSFEGIIGVSATDVTPPTGIYFRNWGAGKQEISRGSHMPLMLSCVSFQTGRQDKPLVLISGDFGVWVSAEEGRKIRQAILNEFNLSASHLMFCLSHTHSGPILSEEYADRPGGELIHAYLQDLKNKAVEVVRKSFESAVPAVLTWHYGHCNLATNRDLPDTKKNRYLVGFNPDKKADNTLLVGRITDDQNRVMGTMVNYACHPTTLAWDNQLISPDYVGSTRALVESFTNAPCLFLQGASGDLAPAEQYSSDLEVAEKNGRVLGYAVLATLESMLPPGKMLSFSEVVESGAPLAVWKQADFEPSRHIASTLIEIPFELKPLPSLTEIERQYRICEDPVLKERLLRKKNIRANLGEGETIKMPLVVWKIGDAFLVGQPNEAYAEFQEILRSRFFPRSIAVMNLVNGSAGYLPPKQLYDLDIYPIWQTPFAAGSLELLTQQTIQTLEKMSSSL